MTDADLENRYSYHPPFGDQAERYARVRAKVLETATLVRDLCPDSSELRVALMYLDAVMFNANAAIARNETPTPEQQRERPDYWKRFKPGVRVRRPGGDEGVVDGPVRPTEQGPWVSVRWASGFSMSWRCNDLEILPAADPPLSAFRVGMQVRIKQFANRCCGWVVEVAPPGNTGCVIVRPEGFPDNLPYRPDELELLPAE